MRFAAAPVVWIVNHYSTIPSKDGAGNRHFRLSQELSVRGWRPVLFLASTRHPSGTQHMMDRASHRTGIDEGIPYVMVKAPGYKGGITRLWNMAMFSVRLLKRRTSQEIPVPDIVIGSTVHPLAAWSALRLARRYRVPFVFEIRDIWPETLIDLGALSTSGLLSKAISRFFRYLASHADLVISPLPGVRAYLNQRGLSHVPFEWVSNGVDLPDADTEEAITPDTDRDFTLMYLGSHGNANGLFGLLDAFEIASAEHGAHSMRLRLVGEGTQKAAVMDYAARLRAAKRIHFEDRIPKHDVITRAREADALVVNIEDLPVYRFGISLNKLFDYMASGRPTIVATSAINNPVAEADAGITVAAGDVQALAIAMNTMRRHTPERRAEMGRRGAAHVKHEYTFAVLAERLGQALNEVIKRSNELTQPERRMKKSLNDGSVIHVSSAHPYTDNRIHYRECVTLARAGYDVRLVACESLVEGDESAVQVTRLPKRGRLRRMLFSSAQAVWIAWRSKAGIVHLHDPELIPYIPLLRLAGRVVIYDAHEDLPVQVLDKQYASRWTRNALVLFSRSLIAIARRADLVIAATESIARRFPENKTVIVRNFPPLRKEEATLPHASAREDIAIYIGVMAGVRGTLELLRAVDDPAFPRGWSLHFAGPMAEDVVEKVREATQSGRVVYHGQLPPLAARDLLLKAKVGIVTLHDSPAHREALPTKLFEYFAAGLPAIASDFPLWRSIVESAGGTLVDETDPSAIAAAIARYASSPEFLAMHSSRASQAAADTLNWTHEGQNLVDAYGRLSPVTDSHGQ